MFFFVSGILHFCLSGQCFQKKWETPLTHPGFLTQHMMWERNYGMQTYIKTINKTKFLKHFRHFQSKLERGGSVPVDGQIQG